MGNPQVTGNREFFRAHASLYERVLDGRCPICNSTITNLDLQNAKAFSKSGLCIMCGKHYGNNLGRALRSYEHELWSTKTDEHAARRDAGISATTNIKLPFFTLQTISEKNALASLHIKRDLQYDMELRKYKDRMDEMEKKIEQISIEKLAAEVEKIVLMSEKK